MSSKGRLFLVDHMCVLPYGHNLNALILFEDAFKEHFSQSFCLASKDLPDYAEQSVRVQRVLYYPYSGVLARSPKKKPSDKAVSAPRQRMADIARLARKVAFTAIFELTRHDLVRTFTMRDWRRVFSKYEIDATDAIFFPSADFYGCATLLDLVSDLPESRRPKIHLRLIGVAENARYARRSARPEFFNSIRRAAQLGVRVTLSAETPAYVSYVERLTGMPVAYLPYPLANVRHAVNWNEIKTITSPGQGRADKGFFRLFPIILALHKLTRDEFHFDVQNMRTSDRDYRARYSSILANVPNLRLRPARLSQAEIDAAYVEADILLLPYDPDTYALRGSAVYQEGLAIGRPVVCSRGMGVSDLVTRYGNGLLATTDDDFASKITQLSRLPKHEVDQMVTAARQAYEQDFEAGRSLVAKELAQ
ncbi:glycosyltransferase [Devosia nitrariae]|uniref:Glycosyltransferase n=1 Tax=Devosia nitrariae TaxID=2071872 RepID=A0ABQ5W5A3_9HYPH|nr:glycosyltransferase [Devosia nitrariae]GLQ54971.1 hypothetical protein GCM10010862_22300 [Devosia nitrariae]